MRNIYILFLLTLVSCNSTRYLVSNTGFPKAPDYKYMKNWAASPKKEISLPVNYIDSLNSFKDDVDVFYIYPTVYYDGYNGNFWNSNPEDTDHIRRVNNLALSNQASIFSGITNVYAPFYRQLFYDGLVYYSSSKILTDIALDPVLKNDFKEYKNEIFSNKSLSLFTYENNKLRSYAKETYDVSFSDLKRAFLKYYENENKGKKIIIASHSQGTMHAVRLINEVINNRKEIRDKLLLAYLVGIPVKNSLKSFQPCNGESDVNCFMSWNTFGDNVNPYDNEYYSDIVATNPISYNSKQNPSKLEDHKGMLMPNFFQMFKYRVLKMPIGNLKIKKPYKISAQSKDGSLQLKQLNIPWIKIFERESYHAGDYNFFWLNIRENLYLRLSTYFND